MLTMTIMLAILSLSKYGVYLEFRIESFSFFNMMRFDVITIFPEIIESYFSAGVLKRARQQKKMTIHAHDLRAYTHDRHRTVDDRPYGGGAGMVMKAAPIIEALKKIARAKPGKAGRSVRARKKQRIILLSARGKALSQVAARRLVRYRQIVFICGRYEGIDERVNGWVDESLSLGPFVLTGGELPALTIVDAVARLLPGVLGNESSMGEESHSRPGYLEYPQYTRPEVLKTGNRRLAVPKVLLSGNHEKIKEWREKHGKTAR